MSIINKLHSFTIKNKKLHAAKIWEILQKILTKVSNNIETNYLAVIYECLSSLGKILSEEGIRDDRFEYFIKKAELYGFRIDKNVPWRLIADLESPAMQEKTGNHRRHAGHGEQLRRQGRVDAHAGERGFEQGRHRHEKND